MKKLSIIIPVHNAEKDLRRCLDSIKNQNFKDFEVILINDASTDNSQVIIDEYVISDKRFISIISKENIYQGLARNLGIERSNSEYITFIDADDWIEKEIYEEMFSLLLESNTDVIECNFKATNQNYPYIKIIPFYKNKNSGISQYILYLYKNNLGQVVWNKIYRSDIIKNNNIKFEDNKKIFGEDLLFNLQVMYYANSIITIDKPLYNYNVRNESVSHRSDFINLDKISNIVELFILRNKKNINFGKDLDTFMILIPSFFQTSVFNIMREFNDPIKEGSTILRNFRKNKLIIKSLKTSLFCINTSFKDKIFCIFVLARMYYPLLLIREFFKKIKKVLI